MAGPNESLVPQLSSAFLRGLEADLRGLSADARKRSPALKEEAERVILCLKEADTAKSEADAADKAAAVFCTACETQESPATSSRSMQVKVALRAVSSLHKLLIHRAVYTSRLPDVLNALERLCRPCVDDNVTVKVLQGILSILTIRGYAKSLTEAEILQAFSLLFKVKTSGSVSSGHAAGAAFSAVSTGTSGTDIGVIEQTAKAAFRQVTSDLFASAADAAVQTAVERKSPTGEFIAIAMFPVEVRAAYSLFMDLINAASGDSLEWIPSPTSSSVQTSSLLDVSLAIEVLDDNLASNIALFAGQPVFSEVLSTRLCPVIHRLLKTISERLAWRSLLSLIVSLVRHYWRALQPDTEAILHGLVRLSMELFSHETNEEQWAPVYAVEALRCIFRREQNETSRVLDLVRAFDLQERSRPCVGEAVQVACKLMSCWKAGMIERVPASALCGDLKPFLNTIRGSTEFRAAIAASFYVQVVDSAWEAMTVNDTVAGKALLGTGKLELSIRAIERIAEDILSHNASLRERESFGPWMKAFDTLVMCLARITMVCDASSLETDKELAIATISAICSNCVAGDSLRLVPHLYQLEAVDFAYRALLEIVLHCRESLGRSWLPILRAIERLDGFVSARERMFRTEVLYDSTVFAVFTTKIEAVLRIPAHLSWKACHDMIAALVQCSRQTIAVLSRTEETNDGRSPTVRVDSGLKIFGMASAESSFLNALNRNPIQQGPEPASLWQLLSGHLISVCMDATQVSLRDFALKTLTRLACGIIASPGDLIAHSVVVAPFLDLLASLHPDVSIGCVNSMYTLLTTQGERLLDQATWLAILQTLSMVGGYKLPRVSSIDINCRLEPVEVMNEVTRGAELVSEGFKVVQVIASDFLASLSGESLFSWAALLRVYCLQNEDVNVALTAVGLIWRTADFLARSPTDKPKERIWVALVVSLKDISLDERPEVRRCAIKTLMGALSSHGSKISPELWDSCLQIALIPLLSGVLEGGMVSSIGEQSSKIASEAPLLLHHSRDTPRKQWNETRVLALSGVAEVLGVSLPHIVRQESREVPTVGWPGMNVRSASWIELFEITSIAACSRDAEVAVAGVSAILDYVHAIGTIRRKCAVSSYAWRPPRDSVIETELSDLESGVMADSHENATICNSERQQENDHPASEVDFLWNEIWNTFRSLLGESEKLIRAPTQSRSIVDLGAVLMLTEGLLSVWHDLQDKFSPQSCEAIASILIHLSFLSVEGMNVEAQTPEELVRLEHLAFSGLREVATTGNATCKFSVVCEVLNALATMLDSTHSRSAKVLQKRTSRAIRIVKLIFEQSETPVNMRLFIMPKVIATLKAIIAGSKSWRRKRSNEIQLIDNSNSDETKETPSWVPAVDVLTSVMGGIPPERFVGSLIYLWVPYLQIVEEFVFEDADTNRNIAMGKANGTRCEVFSKEKEHYAILLTRNAVRVLTHEKSNASNEATQYLLRLLTRGAEEGVTSGRPQFVQTCQKVLFSMVEENVREDREDSSYISSEASRFILQTCDRALRMFILDDQRAGRCPMPAKRREEIVFLLTQLILLQRKSNSSQNQVLTLYPRLCECVESRDEALRYLARELLDEVAPSPHKSIQRDQRSAS